MFRIADLDRDALDAGGHQLLCRHLEAAVAIDGPHRAVGPADLGADRSRHAEAHRAETTGVDPGVRLVELPVLRRPHLVLADAADQDRALGGVVAQLLEAVLRLQRLAGLAGLVGEGELLAPAADAALPRADVGLRGTALQQVADRSDELFDHQPAVTDDRHVGAAHLALLGGVDVDVDDLGVRSERRDLAGDAVVETGTERDQQVAALQRRDGRRVAVHAGHAEAQRVIIGKRAAGHQRGDDVNVGHLGELAQRLGGAGLEDAATDVEDRPLAGEDQLGRLLDHPRVTLDVGPVPGQAVDHLGIGRPVPVHRVLQHVFRHVDQGRAGPAGGGDAECLTHGHGQVLRRHDQLVVLGDATGDADGVAFLKCVGTDRRGGHLAGDAHHRDRIHVGVAQRRDHVGCRRTAGDHGDSRPTGDVGVPLGHVAGTLLVAHQDVADRGIEQRIVRRQDAAARGGRT